MKNLRLDVRNLTVVRAKKKLLQDISFSLYARQTLAIIGAKGAGKGFLLKTLMGIQDGKVTGSITVKAHEDVDVAKLGLVSAAYPCAENLSVFENLSLTLKLMGVHSRAYLGEEVEEGLRKVDLWSEVKHMLHEKTRELDDYQHIRLNLARTLLLKPSVLLLDKPTQTVDPIQKSHYEAIIENLKAHTSIVWVTHDLEQAARVSEQVLFLKDGQVVECGPCEDIFTMPASAETENFISRRCHV
jgi:phosphate transport system ATP-binding protein